MAFPNNVSATIFSRFAFSLRPLSAADVTAIGTSKIDWVKQMGGNERVDMGNIRDMPQFGTPANIIKIPEYGRKQTLSVGAQPDAPDLEFTINFVGVDWNIEAKETERVIGRYTTDGVTRGMMVSLLAAQAASSHPGMAAGSDGIADVPNACIFFAGKIESALFSPMRDDAATVTVALSVQSDFIGPVTLDTYDASNFTNTGLYFKASDSFATSTPDATALAADYTVGHANSVTETSLGWNADKPFLFTTSGAGTMDELVAVY